MASAEVVLISPFTDISALSLRGLSSYLKVHGVSTRMIFLSNILLCDEVGTPAGDFTFPPTLADQVLELCENAVLVGISMMTNYHHSMGHLTDQIARRLGTPVVWGGAHATLRPGQCLEHATYACVGEGEEALLELAIGLREGRPCNRIPNISTVEDGRLTSNPIRPLIQDLDALPFQDYDLADHFLYRREEQRVVAMDDSLLEVYLDYGPRSLRRAQPTFQVMIARGCPYTCTFCGNHAIAALYPGQRYLRRRSNANAVAEIKEFRRRFPFVRAVLLSDDSFFLAADESIKEFCALYTTDVGLPFRCMATPRSVTARKMADLADAGLFFLEVGIQTGSPRINELYQRTWSSPDVIRQAARLINARRDRVMPLYDIIVDNPFSTQRDELDTLRLVLELPKPYVLQIYSLTLFPGTKLLDKALADGLVEDEHVLYQKDYRAFRRSYVNVMYVLVGRGVPPQVIRFLVQPLLLLCLDRPWFEVVFTRLVWLKMQWRRVTGKIRVALRWRRQLKHARQGEHTTASRSN